LGEARWVQRGIVHDFIVTHLDARGSENIGLIDAIDSTFSFAKAHGLIVKYIINKRQRA
jgi:hypothetical protein